MTADRLPETAPLEGEVLPPGATTWADPCPYCDRKVEGYQMWRDELPRTRLDEIEHPWTPPPLGNPRYRLAPCGHEVDKIRVYRAGGDA